MSNGACKFSPFLKMSSTAGNEWSNCQHCVKPVQTIETQFRQYHVTKVGARHICEPHDHKSGGGGAWAPGPNRSLRLCRRSLLSRVLFAISYKGGRLSVISWNESTGCICNFLQLDLCAQKPIFAECAISEHIRGRPSLLRYDTRCYFSVR